MVFNKIDFKKCIDSIQIEGFGLKSAVQAYLFIREYKDRTETITLSYRNYAPHGFYIDGALVDIHFHEVENTLNRFKNEYYPEKHFGNTTIHKALVKLEGIDYSKFELEVKDEFSFKQVAVEIEKVIKNGVFPFFEKYNILESVFKETEAMPIEEMANFIVQPLPQRRMVIKKLCNDINYSDYVNMVIDYYKSENDESWREIEQLDSFLRSQLG